jgi:hypothetical protein
MSNFETRSKCRKKSKNRIGLSVWREAAQHGGKSHLLMPIKNIGMLLLAIWLILSGLINLIGLHFGGLGVVMGVLAIAAGVLIIMGK